jgi:hypothetical protein
LFVTFGAGAKCGRGNEITKAEVMEMRRQTMFWGCVGPASIRRAKVSGCYSYRDRSSPSLDGLFDVDTGWVNVWTEEDGRFEITLEGFEHLIRVTLSGYTAKKVRLWELPYREELIVEMVRESWFREGLQ